MGEDSGFRDDPPSLLPLPLLEVLDLEDDGPDPSSEGGAGGGDPGNTIAPRVGTCDAHLFETLVIDTLLGPDRQ